MRTNDPLLEELHRMMDELELTVRRQIGLPEVIGDKRPVSPQLPVAEDLSGGFMRGLLRFLGARR